MLGLDHLCQVEVRLPEEFLHVADESLPGDGGDLVESLPLVTVSNELHIVYLEHLEYLPDIHFAVEDVGKQVEVLLEVCGLGLR